MYLKKIAKEHLNADQPMKGLIIVTMRCDTRSGVISCSERYFNSSFPELNINVDFMVGQTSFIN